MIYLTGDTHGGVDIKKLCSKTIKIYNSKTLIKNDYVIILGDFGFIWKNKMDKTEKYWMDWFKEKPWTTLFIDGNHENFNRLDKYEITKWNGGNVHQINESVIHLMRGQIFNIDGKKIFTFGGAQSYDKEYRRTDISWWEHEIPDYKDIDIGINNLELNNNEVDYILTHTCPHNISYSIIHEMSNDPTQNILDYFQKSIKFKYWYFGHWHIDDQIDEKYFCLYNDIIQI